MYGKLVEKIDAIQDNDTSNSNRKFDFNTKINEAEKKVPDHYKCITTHKPNKLTSGILLQD